MAYSGAYWDATPGSSNPGYMGMAPDGKPIKLFGRPGSFQTAADLDSTPNQSQEGGGGTSKLEDALASWGNNPSPSGFAGSGLTGSDILGMGSFIAAPWLGAGLPGAEGASAAGAGSGAGFGSALGAEGMGIGSGAVGADVLPGAAAAGGVGAGAATALGVPDPVTGAATPTGAPTGALGTGLTATPGMAGTVPGAPIGTAAAPAGLNAGGAAVAPAAATPPAAGGLTGIPQVDSALNWMKQNASWLAPTAVGAAGMLRTPPQIPNKDQLNALSAEGAGVAKQLISQYQSGQLMPGQQASLDQLTQQTKNQIRQYFASIHQSDSTAAMQAEAQVDQQALQMKQQMLDSALDQGLRAIGVAQGPLNTIANYQLQQDTALRQAFGLFAGALSTGFGRQAGSTATPTPTSTG